MPQATTSMRIFPRQIKLKRKEDISRLFEESVEVFFKVFNFSPGGMTIASADTGIIIELNQSYSKLFGYSRREVIGRTTFEVGIITLPELMRTRLVLEKD